MSYRWWEIAIVGSLSDGSARVETPAVRSKLLEAIEAQPGISVNALARKVGTTWPNAKYHVTRLEQAGQIGTRVVGRHRICFALANIDERLLIARALLAEPTARKLALHILEHEGTDLPRVVADTGESQRVVYYHLKRFLDGGLIEHGHDARYGGLRPTTLLYNALG